MAASAAVVAGLVLFEDGEELLARTAVLCSVGEALVAAGAVLFASGVAELKGTDVEAPA